MSFCCRKCFPVVRWLLAAITLTLAGCRARLSEQELDNLANSAVIGYCSTNAETAERTLQELRSIVYANIKSEPGRPGDYAILWITDVRLARLLKVKGREKEAIPIMEEAIRMANVQWKLEQKVGKATEERLVKFVDRVDSYLDVKWKHIPSGTDAEEITNGTTKGSSFSPNTPPEK